MTVLCAAKKDGVVAFAADSRTSMGNTYVETNKGKIWRVTTTNAHGKSDWLFAGTGAVRSIQVVRYQFTPPHGDESNPMKYMVGTFIPALRTTLKDAGLEETHNGVNRPANVSMLVARAGHIYEVNADYCVAQVENNYWADGSGYPFALGAMHALDTENPEDIVKQGVRSAIAFDKGCGGDIQVEVLTP